MRTVKSSLPPQKVDVPQAADGIGVSGIQLIPSVMSTFPTSTVRTQSHQSEFAARTLSPSRVAPPPSRGDGQPLDHGISSGARTV